MIDRVIEVDPGKRVVAIKNVSINEQFFEGHFPGKPVMPGALIIEAMAQASIVLFYSKKQPAEDKKMSYYLAGTKVRFVSPATPGDQLKITVEPIKIISGVGIISVMAQVGERQVAKGEISFSAKEEV
jgi:3-hydroxyacyl-[acyl-carrier-protein] dehydratase